jgi:hypothetical protein
MRRQTYLLIAAFIIMALAMPGSAHAQAYSLTYSGFAGTCSATGFTTSATASFSLPTIVTVKGSTTLNGVGYDSFTFPLGPGTGSFGTGFSRGFAPALPSASFVFVFNSKLVAPDGSGKGTSVTTITCSSGVFSATNEFKLDFEGPAVPAGWVQKTITCDVAVFDQPGGNPVGSDRIKAGQVFYVNPTPKDAPDGESWSQVFVSSSPDPWIPTKCVGN